MNTSVKNLQKARELLKQLEVMEETKDVWKNYDRKLYAEFYTAHNNNATHGKTVRVALPSQLQEAILKWVDDEILRLKEEIEKL